MEVRWTSMPPNGRAADRRAPGACWKCAPGELGERRGGREAEEEVGGSGVPFLLVAFLWASKEKRRAVGQPPTSYTSLQTTQNEKPPKGRLCYSNPGFPLSRE